MQHGRQRPHHSRVCALSSPLASRCSTLSLQRGVLVLAHQLLKGEIMISLKLMLVARNRFGRRQTSITSKLTMRGQTRVQRLLRRLRGFLTIDAMLPVRRARWLRFLR